MALNLQIEHLLDEYTSGELSIENLRLRLPDVPEADLQDAILEHQVAIAFLKRSSMVGQVMQVHRQFVEEKRSIQQSRFTINPMFRRILAVAASLLVIVGVWYWLSISASPDAQKIYASINVPYEASTFRSEQSDRSSLAQSFNAKRYEEVINAFNAIEVKSDEDKLLAGISFLETNKLTESENLLKSLNTEGKGFKDESLFYLALTNLRAADYTEALVLFEKISNDEGNPYRSRITEDQLGKIRRLASSK